MRLNPAKDIAEKILNDRIDFANVRQVRNGCRVEVRCTKTKVEVGEKHSLTLHFFQGRKLIASLGPVYPNIGDTVTLIGIRTIVDIVLE